MGPQPVPDEESHGTMSDTNNKNGKHESGAPWRNFYGRFKGKALKQSQQRYLAEDLEALSPGKVDWDVNPERKPIDLQAKFVGGTEDADGNFRPVGNKDFGNGHQENT